MLTPSGRYIFGRGRVLSIKEWKVAAILPGKKDEYCISIGHRLAERATLPAKMTVKIVFILIFFEIYFSCWCFFHNNTFRNKIMVCIVWTKTARRCTSHSFRGYFQGKKICNLVFLNISIVSLQSSFRYLLTSVKYFSSNTNCKSKLSSWWCIYGSHTQTSY